MTKWPVQNQNKNYTKTPRTPPWYGQWEFKLVLSYSKPHTFSTFFGEENEINVYLLS